MVFQKGYAPRLLAFCVFFALFLPLRADASWLSGMPGKTTLWGMTAPYPESSYPEGFSGMLLDMGTYTVSVDGYSQYINNEIVNERVDLTYNPSSNKVTGTITDTSLNSGHYDGVRGFAHGSKHFTLRSSSIGLWTLPVYLRGYIDVDTLYVGYGYSVTPHVTAPSSVRVSNLRSRLVCSINGEEHYYDSGGTVWLDLDNEMINKLVFYIEVDFDASWSATLVSGSSIGSIFVTCDYRVDKPSHMEYGARFDTFKSYLLHSLDTFARGMHADLMELKQSGGLGQTNQLIQQGNDLQQEANGLQQEANDLQKEQNETSKGIFGAIKDFFGGFFANLGNTVMGWIVPTSEQLTEFLQEINDWFSARLGFIWYPFSLALDMVAALAGGSADQVFHVPALRLSILGQEYSIWGDIDVDLDAFGIFVYVRFFTSAMLVSGIVRMAIDKWDEWIGGHSV